MTVVLFYQHKISESQVFGKLTTIFKVSLCFVFLFLSGCAQLPENIKSAQVAQTDIKPSALPRFIQNSLGDDPANSQMGLLSESLEALLVRLALIECAKKSIDVQYYIWKPDSIGKLILHKLILAAENGVKVRFLLDDLSLGEEMNRYLLAMDSHENIEVSLFNPFANRNFHLGDYITDGLRMNRRMHNKSFTVDGQITIVGGRNIGDEYFHANEYSNFNDIDVVSVGNSVLGVKQQFNRYWQSEVVYPLAAFKQKVSNENSLQVVKAELDKFLLDNQNSIYAEDIRSSSQYHRLTSPKRDDIEPFRVFIGNVNVLYDDPDKGLGKSDEDILYLKSKISPYFERANTSIELISPYFVPGSDGVELLKLFVDKGLKVRVITNSLSSTDGVLAQSGYAKYRHEMLSNGVALFEQKATAKSEASKSLKYSEKAKSGLHAKIYIIDRKDIFIGSFNFDPRSAEINTEVGILYEVPEMAELIATEAFDKGLLENTYQLSLDDKNNIIWTEQHEGKKTIYHSDPKTSIWRRAMQALYSLLPIDSQL